MHLFRKWLEILQTEWQQNPETLEWRLESFACARTRSHGKGDFVLTPTRLT